jgi:hypothetical protein
LLAFSSGVGLWVHRLRRTPDQDALRRLVEVQLPPLADQEAQIHAQIDRLGAAPGLAPAAARALLVDDVIPRLLRLRRAAEALREDPAPATRPLAAQYLALVDQLIDACRSCVRVIDDPSLPTGAGLVLVRERFIDVDRRRAAFEAALGRACATHRLVPRPAAP